MWRHHFPTISGGRPSLRTELQTQQLPLPDAPPLVPPVPDLVGLPSTDARRLARAARLAVTVEERTASEGLWGRVLEQDPAPGTLGAPDDIVTLFIGTRPRVTVPELRGRDEDEALSVLREVGLGAARRVARRSDRVPEGCIIRTRPRAGSEVPTGSRVSYVVAAGTRESVAGGHRHGRRTARPMRLADGSFVLPSKDPDGSRR